MRGSAPEDEKRTPRPALRRSTTALAAAMLLLPLSGAPSASAGQPRADRLQRAFTEAAARFHVPRSVLLGVSYLESRWDGHGGAPSVSGGYGPMHLTDARTALTRAPEFSQGDEDARGGSSRGRKPVPHGAAQQAVLPAELP
ncbi:N-acetylmuramoyl-L-alanine amidase, partial [Streptomyces lydicus]